MPSTIASLSLKSFDLDAVYDKFQADGSSDVHSDLFKGGRFNKPVNVTMTGRVASSGIETKTFNGDTSHVLGLRLDGKYVEAIEILIGRIGDEVDLVNADVSNADDHWEVKDPLFQGVLEVKLKQKDGKFKAKMNKNFDLKNLTATFIEPNQKVVVDGNIRWWANKQGVVGITFSLGELTF